MSLQLSYACVSHVGRRRRTNQDNFICAGQFMGPEDPRDAVFREGTVELEKPVLFGVFDGMGGGEHGEQAAFLAASTAARASLELPPEAVLDEICTRANHEICSFAEANQLGECGTTAAMLLFAQGEATLCNLGDSRIFWLDSQQIRQISQDHVMPAPFGHKPPLLQYLGIPPREMRLCPYFTARPCCAGDGYLICSDGLTDMLSAEEIWRAAQGPADQAVHTLLEQALDRGGLDNITVILLKIGGQEKGMAELVKRFLRRKRNVTGN